MRRLASHPSAAPIVGLLPVAAPDTSKVDALFQSEAYTQSKRVKEVVEGCVATLVHLSNSKPFDDVEWSRRLRAATKEGATFLDKVKLVTAFYDTSPTKKGNLRVPCGFNAKESGYVGFPLDLSTSIWEQPIRRPNQTNRPCQLTDSEHAILERTTSLSPAENDNVRRRIEEYAVRNQAVTATAVAPPLLVGDEAPRERLQRWPVTMPDPGSFLLANHMFPRLFYNRRVVNDRVLKQLRRRS
jgi:hypothetical protein